MLKEEVVEIMKEKAKCNYFFEYNEDIYFSNIRFNALLCLKKESKNIEFVSFFDNEDPMIPNLHNQIIENNGKLYFIPLRGKGISIYDVNNMIMEYILLSDSEAMISGVFVVDKKLYLIPTRDTKLAVYIDLDNHSVHQNDELQRALNENINFFCDLYGCTLVGNQLIISIFNTGRLLLFDLTTLEYKYLEFGDKRFDNIECIKSDLWITSSVGSTIYRYNNDNGIESFILNEKKVDRQFFRICENNGFMYALPCFGNSIYAKRVENDKWRCIDSSIPKEFHRDCEDDTLFMGIYRKEKILHLLPKNGNGMLEMDGFGIRFIPFDIEEKEYREIMKKRKVGLFEQECRNILYENNSCRLIDYLEMVE
jgi:hypothetical protein